MIDVRNLTPSQVDALKELNTIGVGHATTALSQLIDREIIIKALNLRIVPLNEFQDIIKDPHNLMVASYMNIEGELYGYGSVLLLYTKDMALSLIDMITGTKPGSSKVLTPSDESTLKEIGSILACSYLNAIAKVTGSPLVPSVPRLISDMGGAIIDFILNQLGGITEHIFIIEAELTEAEKEIKGEFIFFPDHGLLESILRAIGMTI
jgi:chemotaxis protein CheC